MIVLCLRDPCCCACWVSLPLILYRLRGVPRKFPNDPNLVSPATYLDHGGDSLQTRSLWRISSVCVFGFEFFRV